MAVLFINGVQTQSLAGGAPGGLTKLGSVGGGGGGPFENLPQEAYEIAEIRARSGLWMNSIQVFYRKRDNFGDIIVGPEFGATGPADDRGGLNDPIVMRPGEFITAIYGRAGVYIDSLQIQTNFQLYNRWGGSGGGDYSYQVSQGEEIAGFWGRYGLYLDNIGVLIRSRS
jgi:hypothetical protein